MAGSGSTSANECRSGRTRRARRPTTGTRTALYLRVSTPDQKPDLQYDGLRSYAARAGLNVIRDYCDVAVSGRREGRPQLKALMTAARNREIDCVLVWKFDRSREAAGGVGGECVNLLNRRTRISAAHPPATMR